MRTIHFYRQGDEYGEFSNFYYAPITLKKQWWRTTEHYFQAQKFAGTKYESIIRKLTSPGLAAREGRDRKKPLRKDWESVKESIMYEALYAKFTQHTDLQELLLQTRDAFLVEHTKNDSYWGDGSSSSKTGPGKNRLGHLLMKLRQQLQQELDTNQE